MFLRIEELLPKHLVGMKTSMTYRDNKTSELWQTFMPRRREINSNAPSHFYSLQLYKSPESFLQMNLDTPFTKWALQEVADTTSIPDGMELMEFSGGTYAVFLHAGSIRGFQKTLHYIFAEWMPASGYELDDRPHFELLDERYKRDSDDSQEEVYIPIKRS